MRPLRAVLQLRHDGRNLCRKHRRRNCKYNAAWPRTKRRQSLRQYIFDKKLYLFISLRRSLYEGSNLSTSCQNEGEWSLWTMWHSSCTITYLCNSGGSIRSLKLKTMLPFASQQPHILLYARKPTPAECSPHLASSPFNRDKNSSPDCLRMQL